MLLPLLISLFVCVSICVAIRAGVISVFPIAEVNARSLHEKPVRTSAGLAIVAATIAGWGLQVFLTGETRLWPVMVGIVVLSLTGFADDRMSLPIRFRFVMQVSIISGLLVFWWASNPEVPAVLVVAALVAILWFINLYNFMDGSDGLAASQTVAGLLPLLVAGSLPASETGSTLGVLACACGGFLFFNWPKAKLFMGDAGSLAIPYLIAGVALYSPAPAPAAVLIAIGFAPFVVDASLTLAIRILLREEWWMAHRSHAYQLLARETGKHVTPLIAVWAYGLFWLWPISWLFADGAIGPTTAIAAAYLPIAAGCTAVQLVLRRQLAD